MKMALIQVYNSIDGELIEKPFRVLLENATSAVNQRIAFYRDKVKAGVPVSVEYDIISTAPRPKEVQAWSKQFEQDVMNELNGITPEPLPEPMGA